VYINHAKKDNKTINKTELVIVVGTFQKFRNSECLSIIEKSLYHTIISLNLICKRDNYKVIGS
jgi:hypothetical protein